MCLSASPLLTDLYQLNMIQAYLDRGETKTAVFELFLRKLLAAILALNPTFAELEEAALRIAGNGEAVGRTPATGAASALEPYVEENIATTRPSRGT